MNNIKVAVRIRPLLEKERNEHKKELWLKKDDTIYLHDKPENCFTFDSVFDSESNNSTVFKAKVQPIVDCAFQGYNGTVFAYGQTAAGKTHTMMGTDKSPGVILKTIDYIFDCIENTPERTYLLRISFMELYNENITDLLSKSDQPLKIVEDKDGSSFNVVGLTEVVVSNATETFGHLKSCQKKCHVAETLMNEKSSRSHMIFRIIIESQRTLPYDNDESVVLSQLNLVDLAGSEKSGQINSVADRFKEGRSINLSLLALSQVISKLSEGNNFFVRNETIGFCFYEKAELLSILLFLTKMLNFINYRDSNITRILKSSLGGNAKTVIICAITPVVYDETLSTLKFAERAKCIKNKPKINAILSKDSLLKKYEREISELQEKLNMEQKSKKCEDLQKEIEIKDHCISKLQDNLRSLQEKLLVSSHAVQFQLPQDITITNRRETWCVSSQFKKRKTNLSDTSYFKSSGSSMIIPEFLHDTPFSEPDKSTDSLWANVGIDVATMTECPSLKNGNHMSTMTEMNMQFLTHLQQECTRLNIALNDQLQINVKDEFTIKELQQKLQSATDALQLQVKETESAKTQLAAQKTESTLNSLTLEWNQLNEQMKNAASELEACKNELKICQFEKSCCLEHLEKTQQELEDMMNQLKVCKDELEICKSDKACCLENLKKAEDKIKALEKCQKDINFESEHQAECNNLTIQIEKLSREVKEKENDLEVTKNTEARLKEKLFETKSESTEYEQKYIIFETKYMKCKKMYATLISEMEKLKKAKKDAELSRKIDKEVLSKELEEERSQHTKTMFEMYKIKSVSSRRIEELLNEIEDLKFKLANTGTPLLGEKDANSEMNQNLNNTEIQKLELKCSELEDENESLKSREEQLIAKGMSVIEKLKTTLASKETEIVELKQVFDKNEAELNQSSIRMKKLENEAQQLNEKVHYLKAEIRRIQAEKQDCSLKINENSDSRENMDMIGISKIEMLDFEIRRLKKELKSQMDKENNGGNKL